MRVQIFRTISGLEAILPEWNTLAAGVPFCQWSWLGAWWNVYGPGRELFVLAVYADDHQLVGLAPWYAEDRGAHGRAIRFLGSGEVCSDYLTLLARPGCENALGQAVGDWLAANESGAGNGAREGRWDLIELANVAVDDPALAALQARMIEAGYIVHQQPGLPCWRIALPDAWETYASSISRPNRRRVRACQKRMQAADVVRRTATNTEELQAGWRVLVELHQQRWTSQGKKGCFASGTFGRFLREAAEQLLAAGSLRLSWIEIGGCPAACLIAFVDGGITYAYQTGMATEFRHENPGWMVQSAAIREAIESGCCAFDLLRGNEAYKGHLGAEWREMVDLRIVSRRLAPQLRHTAWVTSNLVKNVIKSSLLRTGLLSDTGMCQ